MGKNKVNLQLLAEMLFLENLMTKVAPTGILSQVSDSYDFWGVVTEVLPRLKGQIMAREGKFVIRPDSGCPVKILTGYKVADLDEGHLAGLTGGMDKYSIVEWFKTSGKVYEAIKMNGLYWKVDNLKEQLMECEVKGLIEILWDIFGGTETDKGYKMLDEHIGAIYGDSITLERQREIYQRLMDKGFCPEPVLGIGSYSFQYVTRDTHGSAVKATNVVKNGADLAIAKDPKTDSKKKSAKGLLKVYRDESGQIVMKDQCTREEEQEGLLRTVFEDGGLVNVTTLQEVRDLIASQI